MFFHLFTRSGYMYFKQELKTGCEFFFSIKLCKCNAEFLYPFDILSKACFCNLSYVGNDKRKEINTRCSIILVFQIWGTKIFLIFASSCKNGKKLDFKR